MGGKQSRLQREQKHQQRKQKKEKKAGKRLVEEEAAVGSSSSSGSGSAGGLSDNSQLVVTTEHLVQLDSGASDVAPIESALNVTERDIERVGRGECSNGSVAVEEGEEDGSKSSVTITICMLKMEPNAASAETEHTTPTVVEEEHGGVGAGPVENGFANVDTLLSRRPQCACLENGNVGAGTESESACSCNTGSIDNRLNNNELSAPTPSTVSSASSAATNTMSSSSGPSPSVVTAATAATTPQPAALSFMIGGHDPATISHLLHRLRHLHHHHHHHLHHHHHHHLMHLHHHPHHHHHPVTGGGGGADLPADLLAPGSNTIDWRQHQWIPAGMMVGSSNGATARPATDIPSASGGSAVTPASTASQLFMDIDIDLKDKLEGLKLGTAVVAAAAAGTVGQRSSNNNVTEESGEHPYSVGECPTCCAMAMAANAAGGSLGGLLANNGTGVAGSIANGSHIYNGNAGEVEEKILNTSNQPVVTPSVVTGGENVPEPVVAAAVPAAAVAVTSLATMDNSTSVSQATNDQISTEPDNTKDVFFPPITDYLSQ
uniref:Uncharacterized protein n=1 Tax=Anopheles maculatus TaxID=74869 RepID=A0A182SZ58_9DIPT